MNYIFNAIYQFVYRLLVDMRCVWVFTGSNLNCLSYDNDHTANNLDKLFRFMTLIEFILVSLSFSFSSVGVQIFLFRAD